MSGKTAHKSRNNEEIQNDGQAVEQAVEATQESLDKVRDILFGSQMRDQDRRFGSLEEKFSQEFTAFREDVRKQLSSLEQFVTAELSALTARITTESNQRNEANNNISNELRSTSQRLEGRVNEFSQQHAHAESEIRKSLQEQSNTAREELKAVHAELYALVEKVVTELKGAKTDRAALAGLFNEMAGRLQG
ncbi:MAG: hypothetical protein ACTHN5_11780 [Phycisphaerae bacterium]